jgi:hypothetical protein
LVSGNSRSNESLMDAGRNRATAPMKASLLADGLMGAAQNSTYGCGVFAAALRIGKLNSGGIPPMIKQS